MLGGSFTHADAATSAHAKAVRTTSEAQAVSPDVAEWTSHLVVDSKAHGASNSADFRTFAGGVLARTSRMATQLTRNALKFIGVPYVFGGTSSSGFDCSGYVQHVFAMLGISLPRTADAQFDVGHHIQGGMSGMRPGDLVFFQTYAYGASHVGIYLGHGKFVHASSSHGVEVSSLSDSYWHARFIGAKRYLVAKRLVATK
jgi:peptidoglycan DL-endopeptidase CwlO